MRAQKNGASDETWYLCVSSWNQIEASPMPTIDVSARSQQPQDENCSSQWYPECEDMDSGCCSTPLSHEKPTRFALRQLLSSADGST
mmetsp:Transcript_21176/g.58918  ORF Transcript_21176/g.58918 Transcript_21176/m.58918 type:complete len:87 (+) Transcript_21176:531-791(+)